MSALPLAARGREELAPFWMCQVSTHSTIHQPDDRKPTENFKMDLKVVIFPK